MVARTISYAFLSSKLIAASFFRRFYGVVIPSSIYSAELTQVVYHYWFRADLLEIFKHTYCVVYWSRKFVLMWSIRLIRTLILLQDINDNWVLLTSIASDIFSVNDQIKIIGPLDISSPTQNSEAIRLHSYQLYFQEWNGWTARAIHISASHHVHIWTLNWIPL